MRRWLLILLALLAPAAALAQSAPRANSYNIADPSLHLGSVTMNFPTQAAMLAFKPTNVGTMMLTANISGRTTAGDGGAATYVWLSAATDTVRDPFVLASTGVATGRWEIVVPAGGLSLKVGGAKCDGTTDDSLNINNMLSRANTIFGRFTAFVPPGGSCYIGTATQVTVPTKVALEGQGNPLVETNNAVATGVSSLIIDPTVTLKLGGQLRHMLVTSFGLAQTPTTVEQVMAALAAWQASGSVAITANADNLTIEDVEILGFNTAFVSSGLQHTNIRRLWLDNINGLDISGSAAPAIIENVQANPFWAGNLGLRKGLTGATVVAGGTGYTTGDILSYPLTSATCSVIPQIKVVASGGVITGLDPTTPVVDTGSCTTVTGANPKSFTGGTGTGATFNAVMPTVGFRPGICINMHDGTDTANLKGIGCESYHIGIQLSNVWEVTIDQSGAEAGWNNTDRTMGDPTAVGLNLINCVSEARISNMYLSSNSGTGVNFAHNGVCPNGAGSSVSVTNMNIDNQATAHNVVGAAFGAGSLGTIVNLSMASPAFTAGSSATFTTTGQWTIQGLNLLTASGTTTPWYSIDAASAPLVSILSAQHPVPLTSGAALTALCNDTIYVNDTTAPTITMPAVCPLNQNVRVNDIGNNAAAHNITLSMPGGSTIKRGTGSAGASVVMSTNGDSVNVSYNGAAAYVQ